MSDPLVIGLDVGTSGARAVLYTLAGEQIAESHHNYPLETPRPGMAEQDPDKVWAAVARAVAAVAKSIPSGQSVAGIGVSTIFHTLLAVDGDGTPLTRSITWADTRARRQVEKLKKDVDATSFYQRTGCPLHPMYLPGKIRWLREEAPDQFARVASFGSIKDELLARMTGRRVSDRSVASASGLYNLKEGQWDRTILDAVGISPEKLPEVVEPTDTVGDLTKDTAAAFGLPQGTPVIAGAGDGVLSSLGSGAIAPGQMTVMIGTSGATRLATEQPVLDRQGRTWCYYLAQGRWITGAAINNGGLACHWVRDNLLPKPASSAGEFDFATLEAEAEQAKVGSGGVLFLPFLTGERSPYWNASARGVIFGLAAHLGPPHVARSVFEGVSFRMRSIVEALDETAGPTHEYRATGGFTRSAFWLQMLCDVIGKELVLPTVEEASALGAAGLAMIGLGAMKGLDDVARLVAVKPGPTPNADNHALYDRIYQLYLDVYWANQKSFAAIAALQDELG
ncbi:MAG TPA: gluconokinase [Chloroflexota bacterium]|nr:gluconokinase [Chloroflexota bacterium]